MRPLPSLGSLSSHSAWPTSSGTSPGDTWRHKLIVSVAASSGIALLYFGFRLGHQQSQWLAGLGLAVAALVVAGLLMFGGLLIFTKVHWQ